MPVPYRIDRQLSRKLGSRLAYLEHLWRSDPGELDRIRVAESRAMRSLDDGIRRARLRVARCSAGAQLDAERKELQGIFDRLFVPLTCGLHVPDSSGKAAGWPRGPTKPFVSAFLLLKAAPDPVVDRELRKFGVRVRARSRRVCTALVPLPALRPLAAAPFVERVELTRPLFPTATFTCGDAVRLSGILARHQGGEKGDGVVVGVIDDGFDLAHPDFQTVDGGGVERSRVRFLWQQDLDAPQGTATAPTALPTFARSAGMTYGVQYTQAEIDDWLAGGGTALFPEQPTATTHGTMVAGCAAGNGRAYSAFVAANGRPRNDSGTDLIGAAPEADLVFVARQGIGGSSLVADATAVCDGFAYVFARASELGKDCVVNLSQSDNLGPHDGTSEVEAFLDGLLLANSAGRAVTLSAGNSNRTGAHAFAEVTTAGPYLLPLRYSAGVGGSLPTQSDTVEIWYPGARNLTVTLTIPATATTAETVVGPLAAPGEASVTLGGVEVIVESFAPGSGSSDNLIRTTIAVSSGSVPLGDWEFRLESGSRDPVEFHAWVDRNNRGFSGWIAPALLEDEVTLANPSASGEAITVGAHDASTPPAILSSSGCGLTRTGSAKPDLAAHGSWMMAPFPVHLAADPDYPYDWGGGTSAAAALVAGSCAILLQAAPNSTHAQIKNALFTGPLGVLAPSQPEAFGRGFLQI